MRATFIAALVELAEADPRILLLTADLGYTIVEPFADRFPGRFFNVGVAEQNMVGVATGLAEAGFIPFVYSIVPFAVLRPYEFIRNGPILHRLQVRVVGVGGGMEYSTNGATHYGLEDVGLMRIQPETTVIVPADRQQARNALLATWNLPGLVYYRLGKGDKTAIPGLDGRFTLGRAQYIRHGTDLLVIAMGNMVTEAVSAVEALAVHGVSCALLVVACVQPAPTGDLVDVLSKFRVALSVEEHYVNGGIGSLVSEVIAEEGLSCRVMRCAVRTQPDGRTGSHSYVRHKYGLSSEAIVRNALHLLGETRSEAAGTT